MRPAEAAVVDVVRRVADDGFAVVYDLIEAACRGLLDHVRTEMLGGGESD